MVLDIKGIQTFRCIEIKKNTTGYKIIVQVNRVANRKREHELYISSEEKWLWISYAINAA